MASPHVAGLAALVIQTYGKKHGQGYSMDPDKVAAIIESTATDHVCPIGYSEDYTQEGRDPSFNAACAGSTDDNSLYGEGIVNAVAATTPTSDLTRITFGAPPSGGAPSRPHVGTARRPFGLVAAFYSGRAENLGVAQVWARSFVPRAHELGSLDAASGL